MTDLQAMAAQHPLVAALAREVRLGATILEDFEETGPDQAVWLPNDRRRVPLLDGPVGRPSGLADQFGTLLREFSKACGR